MKRCGKLAIPIANTKEGRGLTPFQEKRGSSHVREKEEKRGEKWLPPYGEKGGGCS